MNCGVDGTTFGILLFCFLLTGLAVGYALGWYSDGHDE